MKINRNTPKISTELKALESIENYWQSREEDDLLINVIVSGEDISEEDFYRMDFSCGCFERCRFLDCNFEKSSFVDIIFDHCDFSNSHFRNAYFGRCEFKQCKCLGADFHEAVMKHVLWNHCLLRYTNLNGTLLEYVVMQGCDLTDASLSDVKYRRWSAEDCKFIGTNFFRTTLRGFDFSQNELADILISDTLDEIRGSRISPVQALELVKLLDVEVV